MFSTGNILDFSQSGRLVTDPGTGHILALFSNGQILEINPEDGLLLGSLNLRSVFLAATAVYDIASGIVQNLSGFILNNVIPVGDIALLRRGNQRDLFVTGDLTQGSNTFSIPIFSTPSVIRIRIFPDGSLDARLLIYSSATIPGAARPLRGIAVNSQGMVLTTLPAPGPSPLLVEDHAIAFPADFDPGTGSVPQIILNQAVVTSRGMTADIAGNFYVAPLFQGAPTGFLPPFTRQLVAAH